MWWYFGTHYIYTYYFRGSFVALFVYFLACLSFALRVSNQPTRVARWHIYRRTVQIVNSQKRYAGRYPSYDGRGGRASLRERTRSNDSRCEGFACYGCWNEALQWMIAYRMHAGKTLAATHDNLTFEELLFENNQKLVVSKVLCVQEDRWIGCFVSRLCCQRTGISFYSKHLQTTPIRPHTRHWPCRC